MHGNSKLARMYRLMDAQKSVELFEELVKTSPENQVMLDYWKNEYAKAFVRVYGK